MKPHLSLITLAVSDLERSLKFYRDGLGLPTQGIMGEEFENGAVVFFDLHGGIKLALWPRPSLAHDSGVPQEATPVGFSLAHNVGSAEEVDTVLQQAVSAGGSLTKAGSRAFWGGYTGYFQDPDGHLWEGAWNPDLPPPA